MPLPLRLPAALCFVAMLCAVAGCALQNPRGDAEASAPTVVQQQTLALSWLSGEWDNHAQVETAALAKAALPPRVHLLYAPLRLADRGHWLLTQHSQSDNPTHVFQNRLYRLDTDAAGGILRLHRYRAADEQALALLHQDAARQSRLQASQLTLDPGCSMDLRFEVASQRFVGSTQPGACTERNGGGQSLINTTLAFGHDTLQLQEAVVVPGGIGASTDLRAIKVRYFDGWAVIHRDGARAEPAAQDGFRILRTLRLYDQGTRFALRWDDGKPTGYSLELARLTYPGEVGTILRLALLDDASGRTLAYAWANPDATRIGLNVGWFQSGFTVKAVETAVGWR